MQKTIYVVGEAYSGCETVCKYISNQYDYRLLKLNDFIDVMYNDFAKAYDTPEPQRSLKKFDAIMLNAQIFYHITGIPDFYITKIMYNWIDLFKKYSSPAVIKWHIYQSLVETVPAWRKMYCRDCIVEHKNTNFVVCNIYDFNKDVHLTPNSIVIYVEATPAAIYKHTNKLFNTVIYNAKFTDDISKIKDNADFVITNNGTRPELYKQIQEIMKVIGD